MNIDAYLEKSDENNSQNKLAPFQRDAVEAIIQAIKQERTRILVQIPAGAGKTMVLRSLVESDALGAGKILILVSSASEKEGLSNALKLYQEELTKDAPRRQITVETTAVLRKVLTPPVIAEDYHIIISLGFSLNNEIKLLLELNAGAHEKPFIISIVSAVQPIDIENYGEPVFVYNFSDAIRDNTLLPVQYHSLSKLESAAFSDSRQLAIALEPFVLQFPTDAGRNAMVICSSKDDVDAVMKCLTGFRLQAEIRTDKGIADDAWKVFRDGNHKTSFIIITSRTNLTGVDFPYLTDIVLLRSIGKKTSFDDVLSRVMGKADGKEAAHVWDFGDNQRHFDRAFGQVITSADIIEQVGVGSSEDDEKIESKVKEAPGQVVQQFITPVGDNVSKEDLLGRTRLLHVLKGLIQDIRNTRDFRPFVVGLFGRWGAGKSTVVCLLQKEFENDNRFTFISFNAWQNEHCTHMGAALAHQIISQLYQKQSAIKKLWLALKQNLFLRRDKITAGLYLFGFLSLMASLSVQVDVIAKVFEDKRWPSVLQNNSFASFFSVFLFLTAVAVYKTYWTHPFTDKIKKVVAKPDYSAHLGISEQIKEEIGALFKVHALSAYELWKKKDPTHQFVVVIDDLDRCSDAKIIEVLEAIRLIIDMQNVVVMLTVDQNILLSAVANKYSQQNKNYSWEQALALSRDFLGKIVQISIELDTPDAIQSKRFVAKRLYSDTTDIETVHKHILSSRESNNVEEKNASDVREMLDLSLKDLFGEDDDVQEDTASDIQTSNEYLKSTAGEAETFSKCVGAFDIANPRTLVRIHNTITLLKGLYPELVSDKKEFDLHIYLAFLHEVYAMRTKLEQTALEGLFHDSFVGRDTYLTKLRRLGDQLEVRSTKKNIRTASNRIKRLSLPSVNNLDEIMTN